MKWINLLVPAAVLTVAVAPSASIAAPTKAAKSPQKARTLAQTTQDQLRLFRSLATGIGGQAIQAPFGRFLLIKSGPQCLALRITEHVNFNDTPSRGGYTAKYEWFLQADGSIDFSKTNVQKGTGEVSEARQPNSAYRVPTIQAGSFPHLEWSSSDWIYFAFGATPVGGHPKGSRNYLREKNIRMARTEWVRIEDVNPNSPRVTWISKAQAMQFDTNG